MTTYYAKEHCTWGDELQWFTLPRDISAPNEDMKVAGKLVGWMKNHITPADEVIWPMASGRDAIFRVVSVRAAGDPMDMFFAEVEFEDYVGDTQ